MTENGNKPSVRFSPPELRGILLIGDILVSLVALYAGKYAWVSGDNWRMFSADHFWGKVDFWFYILPLFWLLMLVELYDPHRASNWRQTLRSIIIATIVGLALYGVIYMLSPKGALPRRGVAVFLMNASLLTLLWRTLYIRIFTDPAFMRRILIVGAGRGGATIAQAYKGLWPPPFYLIGFVDDDHLKIGHTWEGYPVLGGSDQLLGLIAAHGITDIVVAITGELRGETFQILLDAQEQGVEVQRMPTMYEELMSRVPIHHLESDWLLRSFLDQNQTSGFFSVGKRLIDILGAIVGIGVFLVIFPFVALATILDSGFPIFYSQMRLGKGGKPYRIYKIRTMYNTPLNEDLRPTELNDPRVTRVGNFLRKAHIDEVPQLLNVLRGEMSFVGPRAEISDLVEKFQQQIPFYRARLLVKPGITGWAQVNYGYVSTIADTEIKLEYDLYYIKHRSLIMDIVILLRTFGAVFGLRGR